ncbi:MULTISPECIES: pentapeptide repeat-containing protein [Kamptonema]|uniref:pentapeptide repeat-containing protein n=1 Tax=Kamptonema TaxID=1501433 RepID=UPI0001DACEBA|nr:MULTISPECIES: pentapeptide repeat-containing protein [Kamptonema]CBN54574.1 putative Periplasmic binding protein/LacI transcriptional regulator [Kamptonema sp. PCC 6506]
MTIEPEIKNNEALTKSEISPEQEKEAFKLKNNLQVLLDSFNRIAAISDSVEQEYAINQEAKQLDISPESYRRMFENYGRPKKAPSKFDPVIKPVSIADKKVGDFIAWFQSISIFKLTTVFSEITLLVAMLSFFVDAPRRHQEAINDAQQVVQSAKEKTYSQGRIDALTDLNKYCVSVTGVSAVKAELKGIELNNCYVYPELGEIFSQWPPLLSKYRGFDLSYANLEGANLEGANLKNIDFRGANLAGANLVAANLAGANLAGANLKGAKLWRANLEGANLENSNLQNSGLGRANLRKANFQGANLSGAKIYWSNIQGANFSRSNLQGANFSRSKLQGADLYRANLQGASFRHTDLREGTNFREAELKGADFRETNFWSTHQLKRGKNWEQAFKNINWELQARQKPQKTFQIGLIKGTKGSLFTSYQKGMEKAAAARNIKIVAVDSDTGVEIEAQTIRELVTAGTDAIVLLPEDPNASKTAIQEAYESGVAVVTVGACLNELEANRYVFACYRCDRYQMGYDSGDYLAKWVEKKMSGKEVNIGLLDNASYDSYYPTIQGFYAAMKASNIRWNEVASTNAALRSDLPEVKQMLQDHPTINILWGGSNAATDVALQAVDELNLEGKVFVFGMSNLTEDKAELLLNPNHPLELIIDQSGRKVGYEAAKTAIAILNGDVTGYKFHLVKHRLFKQDDNESIRQSLNAIEKSSGGD